MAIDSYSAGVLLVLATAILAVLGFFAFRHCVKVDKLPGSLEAATSLLGFVGTMYAVLLGLVVVEAMSRFQSAEANVQNEANAVADVFLLAERFPADKETAIKQLCASYVRQVIDVEWKSLDDGKHDPESRRLAVKIMRAVEDFEPSTEAEKAVYPMMVQASCQLWDSRRIRVNSAQHGVPGEEWMVLLVGGWVTIFFTYFISVKNTALQITLTTAVAVIIALNLLLVLWFGYPYSGDRKVHPDAFKVDRQIFEDQLGNHVDLEREELRQQRAHIRRG